MKFGTQTKRIRIESEAAEYFGNDSTIRFGGTFNVRFYTTFDGKPDKLDVTISNVVGVSQTRQASACR